MAAEYKKYKQDPEAYREAEIARSTEGDIIKGRQTRQSDLFKDLDSYGMTAEDFERQAIDAGERIGEAFDEMQERIKNMHPIMRAMRKVYCIALRDYAYRISEAPPRAVGDKSREELEKMNEDEIERYLYWVDRGEQLNNEITLIDALK